jgi:hypothetical protein
MLILWGHKDGSLGNDVFAQVQRDCRLTWRGPASEKPDEIHRGCVKRAVKGVIDGGGIVASVEIWPDGRISITIKEDRRRPLDPEDDPAVSRRLL